ncbi:outer membrane protein assembly factor BamB family protein [Flavobacterium pedocola]
MRKLLLLLFLSLLACDKKTEYHKGLELVWENKKINWSTNSLVEKDNFIYGHSMDDSIFKLNIANGKVAWKRYSAGNYTKLQPLVFNNKIYFGGSETLKAFDLQGNLIWEDVTDTKTNNLIVFDSVVFNSRSGVGLFANDLETGKLIWKIQPAEQLLSTTKPNIKDNLLIISNLDDSKNGNDISCIDINHNKLKWEILNSNYLYSEALLEDNYVYINSDSSYAKGFTHKIELSTGKQLWKTATNPEIFFKPLLYKNRLFINSYNNGITCIDTTTGKAVWSLKNKSYVADTEFLLYKNIIFFGTQNRQLIGISTDGKIIFKTDFEYGIGNPFVYKDKVYINDGNGRLFRINELR